MEIGRTAGAAAQAHHHPKAQAQKAHPAATKPVVDADAGAAGKSAKPASSAAPAKGTTATLGTKLNTTA